MKTVIINGQSHKGSTYHIARMVADKISDDIMEIFLPRDFGEFCTGCTQCFVKSETLCPHYEKLKPITESIDEADVIIFASPVYVYHATGAMKAFLDHYGYRWMSHRPDEKMFSKQAVCISTAAGAGMKSTNKDMADSAFFLGCVRIYKIGVGVAATSWDDIDQKIKSKIEKMTSNTAKKIKRNIGKAKPNIKTKVFFEIMRMMQKNGWNEVDVKYWKDKDWLKKSRPWKP